MIQILRESISQMKVDDSRRDVEEQSIKTLEGMGSTESATRATTVWHPALAPTIDPKVFEFSPPTE